MASPRRSRPVAASPARRPGIRAAFRSRNPAGIDFTLASDSVARPDFRVSGTALTTGVYKFVRTIKKLAASSARCSVPWPTNLWADGPTAQVLSPGTNRQVPALAPFVGVLRLSTILARNPGTCARSACYHLAASVMSHCSRKRLNVTLTLARASEIALWMGL